MAINCDKCGKFVNPWKPGVGWLFVPGSDVSYEEFSVRCVKCTEKHGKPMPSQNVVIEECCGVNQQN